MVRGTSNLGYRTYILQPDFIAYRQSGFLNKADYVTSANVFVNATAADYVSDQQEKLEKLCGQVGQAVRHLLFAESATWMSSKFQWKLLNSDDFVLSADSTCVSVIYPGLYEIDQDFGHEHCHSGN
ncbi:unnamed protein product [Phytophthora lilii]|uniref:Unnamed protein product n=1 Tax=Phytophthora lilii TaxID=2077276 RepID=A0A9W7CJN5_9STRA|nr:unnamed protein product [Phytophthora lilii]